MGKLKLLVVDDEVLRRDKIRQTLTLTNKEDEIVEASTYDAALEKIKNEKFDIILLDHDLADIHYKNYFEGKPSLEGTGYELAKEIKTSVNKDTTVVVISLNPVGTANIVSLLPSTSMICPVYNIPTHWNIIRSHYERETSKENKEESLWGHGDSENRGETVQETR